MGTMLVKAVDGRKILMPSRGMKAVPSTPTEVPRNSYYLTAVAQGDLEEVAPEAEKPADKPADASAEAKEPDPAPQPASTTADSSKGSTDIAPAATGTSTAKTSQTTAAKPAAG